MNSIVIFKHFKIMDNIAVDLRSNSHSPSSTINEIAQVNKIEYYYYLEDEQVGTYLCVYLPTYLNLNVK